MPNWCDNSLEIFHHDDFDVGRVAGLFSKALQSDGSFDFNEFIPVPVDLLRKEKGGDMFDCIDLDLDNLFESQGVPDEWKETYLLEHHAYPHQNHIPKDMIGAHFLSDQYLKEKYNCSTAYEWRCEYWGTKWVGTETVVNINKNNLYINFQTAWAPPLPVIEAIVGKCPNNDYRFSAYEPGVGLLMEQGVINGESIRLDVDYDNSDTLTEEEWKLLNRWDEDTAEEYIEENEHYVRKGNDE